jgi:hypothetical protein
MQEFFNEDEIVAAHIAPHRLGVELVYSIYVEPGYPYALIDKTIA